MKRIERGKYRLDWLTWSDWFFSYEASSIRAKLLPLLHLIGIPELFE